VVQPSTDFWIEEMSWKTRFENILKEHGITASPKALEQITLTAGRMVRGAYCDGVNHGRAGTARNPTDYAFQYIGEKAEVEK
jgi:hypothetical protein